MTAVAKREPLTTLLTAHGVSSDRQARCQRAVLDVLAGINAPLSSFTRQQVIEICSNVTKTGFTAVTKANPNDVRLPDWAPATARDAAFEAALRATVGHGLWEIGGTAVPGAQLHEGKVQGQALLEEWGIVEQTTMPWTERVCARYGISAAPMRTHNSPCKRIQANMQNALHFYVCCLINGNIENMQRLERLIGLMQRNPIVGRRADTTTSLILLSLD